MIIGAIVDRIHSGLPFLRIARHKAEDEDGASLDYLTVTVSGQPFIAEILHLSVECGEQVWPVMLRGGSEGSTIVQDRLTY